ncbi:hypothetical protein C8J56DRAFT_1030250 [Mycena floridula]|nr:hypothetical protein C8J56DRAFT_1030250 [Mycena floridula]
MATNGIDLQAANRILQRTTELRRLSLAWFTKIASLKPLSFPHLWTLNLPSYLAIESDYPVLTDMIPWTSSLVFPHQDLVLHYASVLALEDVRNMFNIVQRHLPNLNSFILWARFTPGIAIYQNIANECITGLKQLESFGLVVNVEAATHSCYPDSMADSLWKGRPTLKECLLIRRLPQGSGSTRKKYRYEMVNGKAKRKRELCRIETIF